jgi:two-component system cell cycle sensor histidine kinase/response regulator CckA
MQAFPESGDDRRLRFLVAVLSTVAAVAGLMLFPQYVERTPLLLATLASLVVLLVAGVAAGIVVQIILGLASVYLAMPPEGSLAIADRGNLERLVAYTVIFVLADLLAWRLERARRVMAAREREVRESETRYRHILEQASDGIVVATPQGRIVLANERASEMLGYTREELLQLPVAQLYDPTDLDTTPLAWADLASTPIVLRESRLKRKDGTTFQAELSVRMTADGLAQAIVRDVTERKLAEEAMRAERDLLDGILATSVAGILVVNPEGRVMFLNSRAEAVMGIRREELLEHPGLPPGWRFLTLDGEALPDADRPALRVVRTGEPVQDARLVLTRPDGEYIFLSINAAPLRDVDRRIHAVVLSITDITESHCAQQALLEREEQLQRVTSAVPGVVYQFIVSAAGDGRFAFVSERAADLLGARAEEIRLDPARAWQRVLPEDLVARADAFAAASRSGAPWSFEFRVRDPGGRTSWLRDMATAVQARDPDRLIWNGVMVDITDQRRLQDELLQSQKMDSLGRLAGGVAHDFNNLLTVIRGYADVLSNQFAGEDPRLGEVREIRSAADRATSLTRQLLAVSRRQVLTPREVDLNLLVQDMERMLGRVIGENITITTLPGRDLGWVRADPSQLEQVLLNLAVNARDAMPDGGTLTIETRRRTILPGRDDPGARGVPPGDYVVLIVQDTGVGMDPVTQSMMFEPFFTTKPVGEGTGLGLSTVYGIVQQSSGLVTVESEPGFGTAFRIYLPRVAEPALDTRSDTVAVPQAATGPLRRATILLVEDDEGVRRLTRRVLEQFGFSTVEARTGLEALEQLEKASPRIDAVVSDLVMPGMSGRELVGRLRRLHPDMPVVYLSGYTGEEVSDEIRAHPRQTFLQKPFSPDALAAALEELLADQVPP